MGKHFGHLQYLKGVTFYSLSPNELKTFKGAVNPGFVNVLRRIRESLFYIGIPFAIGYAVREWAIEENHRTNRKNPDDFKDDK